MAPIRNAIACCPVSADVPAEITAWRSFCRALEQAGEELLQPGLPSSGGDPFAVAEGVRHLATHAVCWLIADFSAERDLGIYRLNDLNTPWGGPNADNVYRHARVSDQGTYRLHGSMHSCEEFLLAFRVGNLHQEERGTVGELSASEYGLGQGAEVDLLFGPGEGMIPIPKGTHLFAFREYYYDWRPLEPATLMLERLDDGPPEFDVVQALDDAREQFTRSLTFWNEYMHTARDRGVDNEFIPPRREPKGLQTMQYAFCFYSLAEDEALVVRFTKPQASYWSVQLYQLGWFEWLDIGRQTSLNHLQAEVDENGSVTVIVSAKDPGYANWLDTEGRPEALLTLRSAWLTAPPPHPQTQVVALRDLETVVGLGRARIEPAERDRRIGVRRTHLRWRFRT